MEKFTVLVVDDEPNNVQLINEILGSKYKTRVALNGADALERARMEPLPDLILLDVMMPNMDGYAVCQKLKADPLTANIPVIFVTTMDHVEDETKGFEVGAVDYLHKPVSAAILLARSANHLALSQQTKICRQAVVDRTMELEKNQKAMIYMLGDAGHYNDTDTGLHIWRMAAYCRSIAQAADWPVQDAKTLELAAPMHDTGKIGIPDSILKAPRKLTEEEWVIMRDHTIIGFKILNKIDTPLFQMASEIALNHHEKWDGSGYPHKIKGEKIPQSARIVAIADVFDALTMKRPYKEAWGIDKATELIEKESGSHFDPALTKIFLKNVDKIVAIKEEWDKKETEKTE